MTIDDIRSWWERRSQAPVTGESHEKIGFLLAAVDRLTAERDTARAEADVRGGKFCEESRAAGRGPCGACAWCCATQRDRAEKAELGRDKAEATAAREALQRAADLIERELACYGLPRSGGPDSFDEARAEARDEAWGIVLDELERMKRTHEEETADDEM